MIFFCSLKELSGSALGLKMLSVKSAKITHFLVESAAALSIQNVI